MKFLGFVLLVQCVLIHSALGKFSMEKYRQIHNTCVAQSGCDEGIIERARKGDFEPNPKFKEFLKCCFEQEESLNADGTINIEKLMDTFSDDLVEKYEQPVRECVAEIEFIPNTLDYLYNCCYCFYEKTLHKFDIP